MQDTDWIRKKAAGSLNPTQVEAALIQINDVWPAGVRPLREVIENFLLGENALLRLLALSSISVARIVRQPQLLIWLTEPDTCVRGRSRAEMVAALEAIVENDIAVQNFRALRRWKSQEMTRIALRELTEMADLEETTAELSQVAEICIREVFAHWNSKLCESLGSPAAEFAVLALGKLGGRELNHSSDVDLIFLYTEEGEVSSRLSNHQWFNRLAEKILETFSTPDAEGAPFRADLRLRPAVSAGL